MKKPVALIIMDGFGESKNTDGNAIASSNTPNLDKIMNEYPHTLIQASGLDVGLPDGQMGNSEVGHTNIGAGRIVYQDLTRVSKAIEDGDFFTNEALLKAMENAKEHSLHLMGLLSNGGVHSHIDHLKALGKMAKENGVENVFVHAFTDGRDVDPRSALEFIEDVENYMKEVGVGKIASVSGRYYAMDRDKRWERVQLAYDAMVGLSPETFQDPVIALQKAYANNQTDEFVKPQTRVDALGNPIGPVRSNDVLLFWNFREDRARELTKAFISKDFNHFVRRNYPENLYVVTMTGYEEGIDAHVIFPPTKVKTPIAEYISDLGFKQMHISETEKQMHVTYFFNGGVERPHVGEDFFIIPSQKVENYASVPQMSSPIIRDEVVRRVKAYDVYNYKFILINFANPDMLGHTGNYDATVRGNEIVDSLTADISKAVLSMGGAIVITADHGNCETMINRVTKEVDIAHTNNPVPLMILSSMDDIVPKAGTHLIKVGTGPYAQTTGLLADVAPTCLGLLGLDAPESMTGVDLRNII